MIVVAIRVNIIRRSRGRDAVKYNCKLCGELVSDTDEREGDSMWMLYEHMDNHIDWLIKNVYVKFEGVK